MTPTGEPLSEAERALNLPAGSYPFRSHFAEFDGARLHYIDEGQGPVLLMVHGNPARSFLYRKLIVALRDQYRCIAIDLPGFGLSRPPAGYDYRPESHYRYLAALIRHLDLRDATLIAHDWGGPVGLMAMLSEQHRFKRCVLGNTWAWPVNDVRHFAMFSAIMGGPLGRWLALRWNLFVNGLMPSAMRRGPLPAAVHQAYRAPFQRSGDWTGTHVFPRCIMDSHAMLASLEQQLKGVKSERFLLLWPQDDVAFKQRELDRWQQLLPLAERVMIPRCGHYLWEEASEDVLAALRPWLLRTQI